MAIFTLTFVFTITHNSVHVGVYINQCSYVCGNINFLTSDQLAKYCLLECSLANFEGYGYVNNVPLTTATCKQKTTYGQVRTPYTFNRRRCCIYTCTYGYSGDQIPAKDNIAYRYISFKSKLQLTTIKHYM